MPNVDILGSQNKRFKIRRRNYMKKKVLVIMAAALMLNVMNVSVYAETDKTIENRLKILKQ